jgi:transposase
MNSTRVAVDVAKSVFQVGVSSVPGRVDQHRRLSREGFRRFFAAQPSTEVLMEACGTAHHWGRELEALGHQVRLLPPSDVARYRDGNKTDRADVVAILEASRNEAIDAVPVKTLDQQALTSLHRLRSAYVADRTARINTVRGILREFGHAIPQGARVFVGRARAALVDEQVPADLRQELGRALDEIDAFRLKVRELTSRIEDIGERMPAVQHLRTVPGIGVLTATALVAFVGEPGRFRSARRFASYLGLTPRESSSGLKRRLGRISKRGNTYLRMLLTHGARSALLAARRTDHPDALQTWALRLELRSGHNIATIALANRLARIAWRVWRDQRAFEPAQHSPAIGRLGRGGRHNQ